jgi:hypothetical protein
MPGIEIPLPVSSKGFNPGYQELRSLSAAVLTAQSRDAILCTRLHQRSRSELTSVKGFRVHDMIKGDPLIENVSFSKWIILVFSITYKNVK